MGSSVPSSPAMAMEEKKAAKASVPRAGRRSDPEQRRRYYEKNIQREREMSKAYREKSRASVREYQRSYREKNKARCGVYQRNYRVAKKDTIAKKRKDNSGRKRNRWRIAPQLTAK